MSEIIVLGLIPGTHVQITFMLWLVLAAGGSVLLLARRGYRARLFQNWLIITTLLMMTRRQPHARRIAVVG